jgi:hypothetical protein
MRKLKCDIELHRNAGKMNGNASYRRQKQP